MLEVEEGEVLEDLEVLDPADVHPLEVDGPQVEDGVDPGYGRGTSPTRRGGTRTGGRSAQSAPC